MLTEYFLASLAFLYFYRELKFFLIKRKDFSKEKIIKGAEPFFHKKGKVGVLLVHGFSSSCYDYIELGKYLSKKNITNMTVLLKGHGTSPEHLMTTNDIDWKKSLVAAMKKLRKESDQVFICGDSMGGSLALWYASKYKVDGVLSLGTPIFLKREKIYKFVIPILRMFKTYQKKWYHAQGLDAKTISERVTYKVVPLKVMIYVAKIVKESKKALKKITAPILIMQSRTDWGVGEGSVDYIYKKVSSNIKKIVWLDDAYHVVTVGKNKKLAFKHIYEFINETS